MRSFFLTVLAVALISVCASAPSYGVSKGAGYPYLGEYQPAVLESLDDLPDHIRHRLLAHLADRLGEAFFAEISFAGGLHVDHDRLYKDEPGAASYRWEVPAYMLSFAFSAPSAGIDRYVAQIALRGDGSVLREIDIPEVSAAPHKAHLIPLNDAIRIVTDNTGIPASSIRSEIDYDADADAFIWRFSYSTSVGQSSFNFTRIDMLAHTGSIIRTVDGVGDF